MNPYNHQKIEKKWQKVWNDKKVYQTLDSKKAKAKKLKPYYVLDMFPYPSGSGLHVGHPRGYIASDVFARMKRMQGFNVLHPMGYDAFGLPAEQFAVQNKVHPEKAVKMNVGTFRKQLQNIGFSYDWSREVNTTDPEYYRWTQWIFLQIYNSYYDHKKNKALPIETLVKVFEKSGNEMVDAVCDADTPKFSKADWKAFSDVEKQNILMKYRLAYEGYSEVNWCAELGTVLANDEVIEKNGKMVSERGEFPVVKKQMRQWFMRITAYADRLLTGLEQIDWPNNIKEIQRNWIGKSEGAEIDFAVISEKITPKDSLKFAPEWTEKILGGIKTDTVRYERKNLKVGDYAEMMTRFDESVARRFGIAEITKVEEVKLKEIPLDRKSGNTYKNYSELLKHYQETYGKDITLDSKFYIYHFEMVANPIKVFTTRADTLFGVTYVVLAPEHSLVSQLKPQINNWAEVEQYIASVKSKSDEDRVAAREKTGVRLGGVFAVNPANGEQVPVWIADYVLANYGTGAVMAVPAHDERDFEFAKKYDLPLREVVIKDINDPITLAPIEKNEGAFGVVINAKGEILLQYDGASDHWRLPGGSVDADEAPAEAALREVVEETGYQNLAVKGSLGSVHVYFYKMRANKVYDRRGYGFILDASGAVLGEPELSESEKTANMRHEWVESQKALQLIRSNKYELGEAEFVERYINNFHLYTEEGVLVDSETFNGLTSDEAKKKITESVGGKLVTKYKMRDAIFARQRYWGEPIPLVHEKKTVPYFKDSDFPPKTEFGEPVYRKSVAVVLTDSKNKKVLVIKWKKYPWVSFVGGGIEETENVVEAARREVWEETGYNNVRHIKTFDQEIHVESSADHKKENRYARITTLHFELVTHDQDEIDAKEAGQHEAVWVDSNEVKKTITGPETHAVWEIFTKGKVSKCDKWLSVDSGIITPVPEKNLPLKLPNVKSYQPSGTGESPLATVSSWVKAGYETNTMPGWAGSSWYFLRYLDPKNKKEFAAKSEIDYWGNVDMYVGGAEHATGHLLYSRFWNKFLKDLGYVKSEEPFQSLRNQGMILGPDGVKMSKRYGNVINPDDVVRDMGADTLRVYEAFMGPFEGTLPWSTDGIVGSRRFIERVWRLASKVTPHPKPLLKGEGAERLRKTLHKTIKKVTEDIQNFSFNTAVSAMMILVNEMEKSEDIARKDFAAFLQLLAPFAPHITDELWSMMGEKQSIHISGWPNYDPKLVVDNEITLGVQVNGKVRGEITIATDALSDDVKNMVMQMPDIAKWFDGKEIKKFIYVPGKIISIVV